MANFDIEAIETRIIAKLDTLLYPTSKLKKNYSHEGIKLTQLPCTTLEWLGFANVQSEAAAYTITWRWNINVYVDMKDIVDAQQDLKAIVPKVLNAFRQDYSLLDGSSNKTVDNSFITDGETFTVLDQRNPMLLQKISFEATKEED